MNNLSSEHACDHRGCTHAFGDHWAGPPNAITAARTVATVVLCALAIASPALSTWSNWLLSALAAYWLGDLADGLVARVMGVETRTGAVFDILADRLSVCLIVVSYLGHHPPAIIPACVFLAQFVVVDAYLSLGFLNWSLLSPNYFHLVDRTIHRWNWSPPAKACNTAAVIVIWLTTRNVAITTVVACLILVIKIASMARLAALKPTPGDRSGCAVVDRQAPVGASP